MNGDEAQSNPLPPGFDDVEPLALTGCGQIYRARVATADGRVEQVAVTLVDAPMRGRDAKRLRSDCLGAVAINSEPGVLAVRDLGFTKDHRPFLVTDVVLPGTLATRIEQQGALPVGEVVALGLTLARALQAAHRNGILHLGVAPDVVFPTPEGPALGHFGLAWAVRPPSQPDVPATAIMHAPRELFGWSGPTVGSDTYGLASVLRTALTGRAPFETEARTGRAALYHRLVQGAPPKLHHPGVPEQLATLLDRMMDPDAARRPALDDVTRTLEEVARIPGLMAARPPAAAPPQQARGLTPPAALVAQGLMPQPQSAPPTPPQPLPEPILGAPQPQSAPLVPPRPLSELVLGAPQPVIAHQPQAPAPAPTQQPPSLTPPAPATQSPSIPAPQAPAPARQPAAQAQPLAAQPSLAPQAPPAPPQQPAFPSQPAAPPHLASPMPTAHVAVPAPQDFAQQPTLLVPPPPEHGAPPFAQQAQPNEFPIPRPTPPTTSATTPPKPQPVEPRRRNTGLVLLVAAGATALAAGVAWGVATAPKKAAQSAGSGPVVTVSPFSGAKLAEYQVTDAKAAAASGADVTVTWSAPRVTAGVQSYIVVVNLHNQSVQSTTVAGQTLTARFKGLTPSTTYCVSVVTFAVAPGDSGPHTAPPNQCALVTTPGPSNPDSPGGSSSSRAVT
ncbi:serine/threonine protein kinase [Catenulispora sp. GAS73]|uniref:protein kinase domain-containing protein n=1 Tax=Catenulispora sp. GAS73 TaxID=3156269 RepID=UPI0035148A58